MADLTLALGANSTSSIVAASYPSADVRRFRWLSSPRGELKRKRDRAIGEAPKEAMVVLLSLIADCDLRALNTQRAGKWWGRAYYLLGLPAAVLATVAGAAALASAAGRIPAAIIALVSAGLTTAATFLNSSENKKHNVEFSAAWQQLADDARLTVIQSGAVGDDYTSGYNDFLIRHVVQFNKRKSALLRGDLTPPPAEAK
jgi:hypothetical protein